MKAIKLVLAALIALSVSIVHAQDKPAAIDIPAQPLAEALKQLGQQTPLQIFFTPELVAGKQSAAVRGTMTPRQALDALLKGSGLESVQSGSSITLRRAAPAVQGEQQLREVSVRATPETVPTDLPRPYAGGQVARGGELGILGNRDFMDTPFSTMNYTAELIQNQQARTLADVMANDPSVRNFYSSSFPQDAFFIRGLQVEDFSFGGLYGVMPLLRSSPAVFERVEVLKGPSALLNGTPPFGGVGGTVNLVPKRAQDLPNAQVTASFASDSQLGAHVDVGRRFGTDNSFGVRFNGVYRNGETALESNEQRLDQTLLGLDFRGSNVRASLDLGYQKQKEKGIENGLFIDPGTLIPPVPDASKRIFQPWLNLNTEDRFWALRGEFDLNEQVMLYAAAGGRRNDLMELYAYGYPLLSNGDFIENVGHHTGYNDTSTWQAGLRMRLAAGSVRHELNASATSLRQERGNIFVFGTPGGVDPIPSNIYRPNFIVMPGVAPLPTNIPKESDLKLSSFALADTISMADNRLTLILGARLQRVEETNYNPATGAIVTASDDNKISPAMGIVFRPAPKLALYANYTEGFTPPPSFAANNNQLLPPSVSKQIEAGAKLDLGNAGLAFAVFNIEQPNVIFDPVLAIWTQDGQQRNRGMEFTAFGTPTRGLRVLGGVMLLDGTLTKTAGGIDDGHTALNAPEMNLNLGVEWDASFAPGLTFLARGIHTGKQWVDTANTVQIPAWTRFDIGARYAMKMGGKPVTLRATIENVADKSYWDNSSLYRGAPRTYLLSATMDF